MSDIFISYSNQDRAKAKDLAKALNRKGWSVWWDRKILPGESFDEIIEKALNAARCVIVLWSRTSVASDWVKAEAEEGRKRGVLVPVLLDEVSIPLGFRRIQTADLTKWEPTLATHQGFEELVKAITVKLTGTLSGETMEEEYLPRSQSVQNDKTFPGSSQIREKWHAEIILNSATKRILRVFLSHDVHEVEFHNNMGKIANAESVKVDGVMVSQGGTLVTWKKKFAFPIRDGDMSYQAVIELEPNIWWGTIRKFRLSIAGRVIYAEGNW